MAACITGGSSGAAKHMKPGKSDDFDGLSSDYLKHGSLCLFDYLSLLCTCMLHHSFSPSTCCMSTMIPIPKCSNVKTTKLQGIALSSLISKLFDHCIISCQSKVL